jgi:hypothetical protein
MEAKRSSMKLLFADLRSKSKTWWVPHEINHVSSVTKHLFSVVCFKFASKAEATTETNTHLTQKNKSFEDLECSVNNLSSSH